MVTQKLQAAWSENLACKSSLQCRWCN